MNADDFLMSGGVKSVSFLEIGRTVTGTIAREPEVRQQTDFDSGKPKFYENGDPMMQLTVVLQTNERDAADPKDDGLRTVYVKSQMKGAVRDAVRQAGAPGLKVGGTLTVTYVANGVPKRAGGKPPKQYTATYQPPTANAANDFLNGNSSSAPAAPSGPADPWGQQQGPAPAFAQPSPPAGAAGLTPEQQAAIAQLSPEQRANFGFTG